MIGADKKEARETTLNAGHAKILEERGINFDTAAAAGLRSATASEAKKILGFDPRSGGILIPYFHPAGGEVRTYRFRPDVPFLADGKSAGKYLSPRGVGNLIYFPPNTAARLKEIAEPLLVTEGEFKSLAAAERGLLCLGLAGVWGWRSRGANGESGPIADLDLLDVRGRVVNVVFDSDVVLNAQVRKARHALGKEFYKRGASMVLAVDLPSRNGLKIGLDDFLVAHGRDGFFELEGAELPPTDLPPFTEPISLMLNAPIKPLEMAIENLLPEGASGWRISSPKVGKSWSMAEEVYCLTTGNPVYGRFEVPKKRRCMVIEEEDPQRRFKRRFERIIHAHGGDIPSDEFLRISIKKGFRLDDPKWREAFDYEIKTFRPELVYLDVFSRLHAQDINDAQAMAQIVLFVDQLNRDYGCAIIILHHTRKNSAGGDGHDEIMGSRVLSGFSEGTLFFSRTKDHGVIKINVALKDEPPDGSFEPEFLVRLRDTDDNLGTFFEYMGSPQDIGAEVRRKVLDLITEWKGAREIAETLSISKPTARQALNVLVDVGLAEKEQRGKQRVVYRKKMENEGVLQ